MASIYKMHYSLKFPPTLLLSSFCGRLIDGAGKCDNCKFNKLNYSEFQNDKKKSNIISDALALIIERHFIKYEEKTKVVTKKQHYTIFHETS